MASDEIMTVIQAGQHGSTYGGNPIACKVATAALEVLEEEQLVSNSYARGKQLREGLRNISTDSITEVRGRGLLNAIVIDEPKGNYSKLGKAWEICIKMMENGLLAKPTHGNIIRFAPPLTISEEEIDACLNIIENSIQQVE